jgi:hypothetical protein
MAPGPFLADTALSLIAERLRSARGQTGYTSGQLAGRTGLSKAHPSRLAGRTQHLRLQLRLVNGLLSVATRCCLSGSLPIVSRQWLQRSSSATALNVVPCSGYPGSSALEALRVTISADRTPTSPARHHSEEWLYVVPGTLLLDYDGRLLAHQRQLCAFRC